MADASLLPGVPAATNPLHLIGDFFRFLKAPRHQSDLWKDYFQTRRDARFLREHPYLPEPGKTVLVASMSNWPYQIKLESMLTVGLRLAGWQPVVLMNARDDRWGHRYYEALGINRFVYWNDFTLTGEEAARCEQDSHQFLDAPLAFSAVKNWAYSDCWIGPQILSSVSRGTLQGAPDVTDPAIQTRIRTLLPEALERIALAGKILDAVRPRMMLIFEANYARNAPLTDLAVKRGVNVIQLTQISRDDALMFRRLNCKTRREHPASLSREKFLELQKEPWTESQEQALNEEFNFRYGGKWFLQSRNQPGNEALSRDQLDAQLGLDPRKKLAVVFSHVLWDANLFYGEDLFEDYGDWFIQTVQAACRNPNVNWIVKLHPVNVWKRQRENVTAELSETVLIRKHIGELPPHVKLIFPDSKVSSKSLFQVADYGVSVRGTVCAELPCFGVPAFTAGTGRCHGFGFTIDSQSKEEYLERMASIHTYDRLRPEQVVLARQHAYAAFRRRPWAMKNFKAKFFKAAGGRHPLDHNLIMNARSMAEIEANGDLRKWAIWAENTKEVDYLDH